MEGRGYPLPLKFLIYEGDRESVTIPFLARAQQASSLKPRLIRNGRVKHVLIGCFKVLPRSDLDHKVNVQDKHGFLTNLA
jgi:hypothetical protein